MCINVDVYSDICVYTYMHMHMHMYMYMHMYTYAQQWTSLVDVPSCAVTQSKPYDRPSHDLGVGVGWVGPCTEPSNALEVIWTVIQEPAL